ncbi:hypothetical protein KYK33_18760 [Aeromonas rivuli]|nr:hypothetical protein KYK33_18760 [Aeromonas rivuli]
MLETALEQPHGHKQEAARLLGWGRNTHHPQAERTRFS